MAPPISGHVFQRTPGARLERALEDAIVKHGMRTMRECEPKLYFGDVLWVGQGIISEDVQKEGKASWRLGKDVHF